MTQSTDRLHILMQVVFLMRKKRGIKLLGVLLAVAGAAIVVQMTPLYVWYILLIGLVILLALTILMG